MKESKSVVAIAVALTAITGASFASNGGPVDPIVYDQLTGSSALILHPGGLFATSTGGVAGDVLADSFVLTSPTRITGVECTGGYLNNCFIDGDPLTCTDPLPTIDSFNIRILQNDPVNGVVDGDDLPNGNLPVLGSFTGLQPSSRTLTGRKLGNTQEFRFDGLCIDVLLPPGKYWLDISNNHNGNSIANRYLATLGVSGAPLSEPGSAINLLGSWKHSTSLFQPGFLLRGTIADQQAYCVAKTSSAGCVAAIGASSLASMPISGANDYSVSASNVHGRKVGILFGGNVASDSFPFSGGTLCIRPPLRMSTALYSGGSGPNSCDGSYSIVINDGNVMPAGLDAGAGSGGWYQFWYRDPQNGAGTLGTALSNAVQLFFQ